MIRIGAELHRTLHRTQRPGRVLGGLAVVLGAAVGCTAQTQDPRGDEEEIAIQVREAALDRLSVDAIGPEGQVRIELLRGGLRVPGYLGDVAIDGNYEGDSLVTDSQGHAFLAEFGGHGPIDESWLAWIAKEQSDVDGEQRKLDLALTADAADLLAVDDRFDVELQRLARDVAVAARVTLHDWNTGAPVGEAETPPSSPELGTPEVERETGVVEKQAVATYLHQVYIRWASCCVDFGQHSATRLRVFNSSGVLMNDVKTSNHGRVVDGAGMTTAAGCPRAWSGRTNRLPPFQPFRATDLDHSGGNAGGCNTRYDAVFPTTGGHVCNDDSLAQYSNVKFNAQMNWGTCADSTLRNNAPTCN